jgi:hypothetical protein
MMFQMIYYLNIHDYSHNELSKVFSSEWEKVVPTKPLKVINRVNTNLKSLVLFNAETPRYFFTQKTNRKCDDLTCNTCNYFNTKQWFLDKFFTIPIIDKASCNDKNIIYCLSCTQCYSHYIGETKRKASEGFQEYLSNIKYHFNFGLFKSVVLRGDY